MTGLLAVNSIHTACRILQNQLDAICQFLQNFIEVLHAADRSLVDVLQVELRPGSALATGCGIQVQAQYKGMNVINDQVAFLVNVTHQGCIHSGMQFGMILNSRGIVKMIGK
jgi:hypothetical protein